MSLGMVRGQNYSQNTQKLLSISRIQLKIQRKLSLSYLSSALSNIQCDT